MEKRAPVAHKKDRANMPWLIAVLLLSVLLPITVGSAPVQSMGQPAPARLAAEDQNNWDDRFSLPGVTCCAGFDKVYTSITVGTDVYIGGQFSSVGGAPGSQGIARYDGRRWYGLGTGVGDGGFFGGVYGIAARGDDLYVVGDFTRAGGVAALNLARWNVRTETWSALSTGNGPRDRSGYEAPLSAVAVLGNEIYIGGTFDLMDGVAARRVAMWNGTVWQSLAGGITVADSIVDEADVSAIAASGDQVYVGGSFDFAINPDGVDDITANNIAVWNRATKRWSGLGNGVSGGVAVLALAGPSLYVGGGFTKAGGKTVGGIARWQNQQWSALGTGSDGLVKGIALSGGTVYAAGSFTTIGGLAKTDSLAAWDGTQWRSLRTDLVFSSPASDYLNTVAVLPNGDVLVGGDFNDTEVPVFSNIAIWNGASWRGTGQGLENGPGYRGADSYAVAVNAQGQVFVGGEFEQLGGYPFRRLAMWDGAKWHDVGGGVAGDVSKLLIRGDELYVAGGFATVGNGIAAPRIAKWNMRTQQWSAVGNGLPGGYVNTLAFVGDTLYAGGSEFPSDVDCCLWKFDGTAWSPFSQRYRTRPFFAAFTRTNVLALASDGQRLIVGGRFLELDVRATGAPVNTNEIFVYDPRDDSVATFGTGVDNNQYTASVRTIALANDGIYIGGQFKSINGTAAINIARLDAQGWSALGSGAFGADDFRDGVSTIVDYGTDLYVAGSFETAGVEAFNIARWNTQARSWLALGCGIARNAESVSIDQVSELAIQPAGLPNAGLYAAGGIAAAGCSPSMGFAAWYGIAGTPVDPATLTQRTYLPVLQR